MAAVAEAGSKLQLALAGSLSPPQLENELHRLGALRGVGRANPIAQCSSMICEALPKRGMPPFTEDKAPSHLQLLNLLGGCGALARLHPSCLRLLFEDAQMLAALSELRHLLHSAAQGPLHSCAAAAGQAALTAMGADMTAIDLFWACPLTTVPGLLRQIAAAAGGLGKQSGKASADQQAAAELARAVQAILHAASQCRAQQQQFFPQALNAAAAAAGPEFTAGEDVRCALQALAEAACRLQALLPREAPQLAQENMLLALELTDSLLNAWAATVAVAPPGQQQQQLHRQYGAVRQRLLGAILRHIQEQGVDSPEAEAQLRRVEGLAEAHAAYDQLIDLSRITGDREQLHRQLEQLCGDQLEPPFASYLLARFLEEGRKRELLELPSQFDGTVLRFLSDDTGEDGPARQQLRWLHELRMENYAGASVTLERVIEGGAGDADRLAALQKLSALAVGGA